MEWRFGVALCSFQLNCLTKVWRPGNQTADAFGYWIQAGKTVPERLQSILCVSKTLKDKEEVCRAAPGDRKGLGQRSPWNRHVLFPWMWKCRPVSLTSAAAP